MDYQIEIYDTWGRRIGVYDETPLLEASRTAPDESDWVRGMLPQGVMDLGHVYRIRVVVDGAVFCEAYVKRVEPAWGDLRKLIVDRYVKFHEVVELEAERPARDGNMEVCWAYTNRRIDAMVKDAVNRALGGVHYLVAHAAYPDGAEREYGKFLARKTSGNELEVGGIVSGQWVGGDRMDASGAYAKDGDTIAGLVVDGEAWPDLRLLMIDCEEPSRNAYAQGKHPEVTDWTDEQYGASVYGVRADAAKASLQDLIDTKGLDFVELNPHKDASGVYDNRVDSYGRYVGMAFGCGENFNAAQVELGHSAVYLYADGLYHVPEMELKDFYSYAGLHEDSVAEADTVLAHVDVSNGVFEVLTALAYAAGGYVWSVGPDLAVCFRKAERADRVVSFDPVDVAVTLGSDSGGLANTVYFEGNPLVGTLNRTYTRGASVDEFGARVRDLEFFSLAFEEDADKLAAGLLDDVAYPAPCGALVFFRGESGIGVGDIVELREAPLRRLEREVDGEWGGRFAGQLVGRVRQVTHRFTGKQVSTRVRLTSPLRSVADPISFMVRSQQGEHVLYQFRLDDAAVGLDMGYHLD